MTVNRYGYMLDMLYHPIYSFFKWKPYDFYTLENGEIFLSYSNTFNDKFEGSVSIDYKEFEEQCLRLFVGDAFFKELVDRFKFCKDVRMLGSIFVYTTPNGPTIPNNISEELKKLLLKTDWMSFESRVKNKYKRYNQEIDKVRKSFGIKCFTKFSPEENSIMWAFYGNNYKGFNCYFDLAKTVYDIPSIRCDKYGKFICEHFEKVRYKRNFNTCIQIDSKKLLDIPINEVKKSPYIIKLVRKALSIKQSQWSNEEEIRLIIKDDENIEITERTKKGFKIKFPYLSTIYFCGNRKIPLILDQNRDTIIHNKAKSLAKKLQLCCIRLTPSREHNRFDAEQVYPYPYEHPHIEIIYSEDDIPF